MAAKVPLNVRIKQELRVRLQDRAKAENRTMSNLVETALLRYLGEPPRHERTKS